MKGIEPFFLKKPDSATITKIDIFKKYFGIYFKLIQNIQNKNEFKRRIKYIDLFSGPGYFLDGSAENNKILSTPLLIAENCRLNKYCNIDFYFNDYVDAHIKMLEQEMKENGFINNENVTYNYSVSDARNVRFENIFKSNDIVISLVDSFSYLCLDKNTINTLVGNYFSDLVCYFRVSHIFEHIGNSSEKNNYINLVGSENNYNKILQVAKSDLRNIDKVNLLLKMWTDNINSVGQKKYVLPFFIQYSHENTKVESVVMIVSKNKLGLNSLKSMITDVEVFEGKFYSYIGAKISRNSLLDLEEEYLVKKMQQLDDYVNINGLLEYIDNEMEREFGYISAYSETFIKNKLDKMEKENILEVDHRGSNKRFMRKGKNTYGKDTYFRIKVKI